MKEKFGLWFHATRPKTLPASFIPVMTGTALAFSEGKFDLSVLIVTLLSSLLIQVITNFVNEIYDFKRGADTSERLGPERAVASGKISPKSMKTVSAILTLITLLLGLWLVLFKGGGFYILAIGLLSLIFAYGYTAGPFPLAYKGLSEIFVFLFFGLFAVSGTYYLQTGNLTIESLITGFGPGFISMNILGVNNIRDIQTDFKAGKITLAVRIGRKNAIALYIIFSVFAFITPFILTLFIKNYLILLPVICIPFSFYLTLSLIKYSGKELNKVLSGTGQLLVLYGVLNSISFLLI